MKLKPTLLAAFASAWVFAPFAIANSNDEEHVQQPKLSEQPGLVMTARQATRLYRDPAVAEAEGWINTGRCVSAPLEGALGIHFVNPSLLLDGAALDPERPELLNYEMIGGKLRLVGVEYVVFAEQWDAAHPDGTPPILMGQLFDYVEAPNRYRLPAIYTLHVWAWKRNPWGSYVLYNPRVSCDRYEG